MLRFMPPLSISIWSNWKLLSFLPPSPHFHPSLLVLVESLAAIYPLLKIASVLLSQST
jgi:hypothetical protein